MKRSDALPSASRSLQAEVGVTEFSGVSAYNPMSRNLKRKFTEEFKREAVKLIEEQGRTVADVARSLGVR